MIRFGNEQDDQAELDPCPDQQHVEGPSPVGVLVDEAPNQWADFGPMRASASLWDS